MVKFKIDLRNHYIYENAAKNNLVAIEKEKNKTFLKLVEIYIDNFEIVSENQEVQVNDLQFIPETKSYEKVGDSYIMKVNQLREVPKSLKIRIRLTKFFRF